MVGAVTGGFPPIGLPAGITWSDVPDVLAVSFSCCILIIAQSAATFRSFAAKHGDRATSTATSSGCAGANLAAGLSAPSWSTAAPPRPRSWTAKGRTQLAELTMSWVALLVTVFFTGILELTYAVLAAIVFLIGISLIDVAG